MPYVAIANFSRHSITNHVTTNDTTTNDAATNDAITNATINRVSTHDVILTGSAAPRRSRYSITQFDTLPLTTMNRSAGALLAVVSTYISL